MKRIISLCCVCSILLMSLAVPARADSVLSSSFMELLDYNTPAASGYILTLSASKNYVDFSLPARSMVYYVDVLMTATNGISTASFSYFLGENLTSVGALTVEAIGNDLYRIYGKIDQKFCTAIRLTFDAKANYVSFQSVKVSIAPVDLYDVKLQATGFYPGGNFNMSKNYGDDRPVSTMIVDEGTDYNDRDFVLYLEPEDWSKFDYLQFQLSMIVGDVYSISCVMGQINVPFSYSLIQVGNSDSMYYLTIDVDCRGLDRTSEDFPMVIIEGHIIFDGISDIRLMNTNGLLEYTVDNPTRYFFKNLSVQLSTEFSDLITSFSMEFTNLKTAVSTHFSNLETWIQTQTESIVSNFSTTNTLIGQKFTQLFAEIRQRSESLEAAIRGDTSSGDDFQDEVQNKEDELDDMAAVMDSVTKPDIDDIDVSIDQFVAASDVEVLATPLTVFLEADLFRTMIIMSIILATVSYTLYGKR